METSFYDRYVTLEEAHWWFAGRRRIVNRALEVSVPRDRSLRILEVGCGTGGVLSVLGRFGKTYGLEFSHQALMHARKRNAASLVCGDSIRLPFVDGAFDVVGMFDVLEHIDDDQAALRELHRVVRPGGQLIVSVPAFPFLWGRQDVVSHHYRRYVKPEILERLRSAGFEPGYTSYFNTWLFPVVAAIRVARRLIGSESRPDQSDFDSTPPALVNNLLARLMSSEAAFIGRMPLPVGVSLLSIAARP
jgi:SAM-dependent methyltransferase